VCSISISSKSTSISNNRVTCQFSIKSEASLVPLIGLLGTFQERVDCSGEMSGKGHLCDGCSVCKGNGSTCNSDCDLAVASGRQFDDCQMCGGSTFYFSGKHLGLPWQEDIDESNSRPFISETDFKEKYCPGYFELVLVSFLSWFFHAVSCSYSCVCVSFGSGQ
jgi:hypothetical protein